MAAELLRMAPNSDNIFRVFYVKKSDGGIISGGTGSLTLINKKTDQPVAGVAWPVSLTWNASNKAFEAIIPSTAVVQRRDFLKAVVEINSGPDIYYDEPEVQVRYPSDR